MKKYIFVAIFSALLILWIAFIWYNSMQTGTESGKVSSEVTEKINEVAEPVLKEPVTEKTVRKSAHFVEYMLLGVLGSLDAVFISYALSRRSALCVSCSMLPTLALAFAVASVDEFAIQAATDGRGPSWRDVGIDSAGALTGIAVCVAVFLLAYYLAGVRQKKLNLQK